MLPFCCCNAGACGWISSSVVGCGKNLAGFTLTLWLDGSAVGTCVSTTTGPCTWPISSTGTYTVTIAGSATGYLPPSPTSQDVVVTRCSRFSVSSADWTLVLDDNFACGGDPCCAGAGSGPPYPSYLYPDTLYFDDGFGTVACTKTGSLWVGSASRFAKTALTCTDGGAEIVTNTEISLTFFVNCDTAQRGGWQASIGFYSCKSFGVCNGSAFPCPFTCPGPAYVPTNQDSTCTLQSTGYYGGVCLVPNNLFGTFTFVGSPACPANPGDFVNVDLSGTIQAPFYQGSYYQTPCYANVAAKALSEIYPFTTTGGWLNVLTINVTVSS